MPAEFQRARDALMAETHGRGLVVVLLAVFIGLGLGVAWLFLWATRGLRRRSLDLPMETVGQRLIALIARLVYGVLLVAAFGLGSIGAFLIFDWPPLLREILLQYLMAFLEFCLVAVVSRFLLAPGAGPPAFGAADDPDVDKFRILPMDRAAARFWHRRILVLAGWYAFGYATVMLLSELGFDLEARRLVAYILGLGLLAIGLEMVWRHPPTHAEAPAAPFLKRRAIAWLLSILFLLLWLLWVASAVRGMWLLAVLIALPWAIRGARRAVGHLLRPPGNAEAATALPSVLTVALERGLQALLIIGGALFLAHVWNIDLVALTSSDTVVTRLLRGLLSTVVIVLVADFGWQLAKTAIDRKIVEAPTTSDQQSQEWRRQSRMKTLLPIFRNLLFIVLLVMVVMMALAALGVDIGPLVAGASVVGVAIGFGAQTLVRDIISGMFYLLDDAFRVGEYIQSGSYKGTVESFSLRSVKLRHHRGPLYTVPFGVLGAIQNMSRDWVIDKLSVGVTYDTDLEQGEEDHQADRQGAAGGSRVRAQDHGDPEDAGRRRVRRFRHPDPDEADDPPRRAVRHPPPRLCHDQEGLRRQRHQLRLSHGAGRRRRDQLHRRHRLGGAACPHQAAGGGGVEAPHGGSGVSQPQRAHPRCLTLPRGPSLYRASKRERGPIAKRWGEGVTSDPA